MERTLWCSYIYKEGFARLATVKYSSSPSNYRNRLMHLTNTSVQRKHAGSLPYDKHRMLGGKLVLVTEPRCFFRGTKLSFEDLSDRLEKRGIGWAILWEKVKDVVVRTLVMCEHMMNSQVSVATPQKW